MWIVMIWRIYEPQRGVTCMPLISMTWLAPGLASRQMAQRLMDEGFAGALVPSFTIGARADWANLVLWDWGDTLPHRVAVYDPNHQLPHNQRSWV